MNRRVWFLSLFVLVIISVILLYVEYPKSLVSVNGNDEKNIPYNENLNWTKEIFVKTKFKKEQNIKVAFLDTVLNDKQKMKVSKYNDVYERYNINTPSNNFSAHGDEILNLFYTFANKGSKVYYSTVASQEGEVDLSSLEASLKWAIDNDVDIINLSLTLNKKSEKLDSLLEDAHNKGIITFAAAGNEGDNHLSYPSSNTNVKAVGGLNRDFNRWYFSNYSTSKTVYFMPSTNIKISENGEKEGTSYSCALLTTLLYNTLSGQSSGIDTDRKEKILDSLFKPVGKNFMFPNL